MLRFLLSFLCCVYTFSSCAYAETLLQYNRKPLNPSFFVPNYIINSQEKLPPLIYHKHSQYNSAYPENDNNANLLNTNLSQTPKYKKIYNIYIHNIKNIAQTGIIPHNPELEADLLKMNSNDRFLVQ